MGALARHLACYAGDMSASQQPTRARALLHYWFVEHNPLYLVSAALVLVGVLALSRAAIASGSAGAILGVGAIADVYALALVFGAALLTRVGQRRPAVMLALLTLVYQGDVTLHTEATAYLGVAGIAGAIAWVLCFAVKLRLLAWALRVRLDRAALALPTLGALGLAGLPRTLPLLSPREGTVVVTLFVFGLALAVASLAPRVESRDRLTFFGGLVLVRCRRAAWAIWSVLLLGHVVFWSTSRPITLAALAPVPLLVATRFVARERALWLLVLGAAMVTLALCPETLWLTCLMAAIALVARALVPRRTHETAAHDAPVAPYRMGPVATSREQVLVARAEGEPTRTRLLFGAAYLLYFAVWMLDYRGGAIPAHALALDAALVAVVLAGALASRRPGCAAPLGVVCMHAAIARGLVSAPTTALGWGGAAVGLGFALLGGSLLVSFRLRDGAAPGAPAADPLRNVPPPAS